MHIDAYILNPQPAQAAATCRATLLGRNFKLRWSRILPMECLGLSWDKYWIATLKQHYVGIFQVMLAFTAKATAEDVLRQVQKTEKLLNKKGPFPIIWAICFCFHVSVYIDICIFEIIWLYVIYTYIYSFSFQGLASKESVITPFRAYHDVVAIFAPEKTIVETCMATSKKRGKLFPCQSPLWQPPSGFPDVGRWSYDLGQSCTCRAGQR